jgi:hypothetical protein
MPVYTGLGSAPVNTQSNLFTAARSGHGSRRRVRVALRNARRLVDENSAHEYARRFTALSQKLIMDDQ